MSEEAIVNGKAKGGKRKTVAEKMAEESAKIVGDLAASPARQTRNAAKGVVYQPPEKKAKAPKDAKSNRGKKPKAKPAEKAEEASEEAPAEAAAEEVAPEAAEEVAPEAAEEVADEVADGAADGAADEVAEEKEAEEPAAEAVAEAEKTDAE